MKGFIKKYSWLMMLLLTTHSSWAQFSVSGQVRDDLGDILLGALIVKKGTTQGVVTDIEGNYTIEGVENTDVLTFSYLGYVPQEVAVSGRTIINVTLESDLLNLDEVVVLGYTPVKKRDVTGAVGQVSAKDLLKSPLPNFDQAISGRIAGVNVTSSDGSPGEQANIVIRGGNSITGDNSPLYVVDGIPFEYFDPASISSQDIKSFDVLKDASATAIYGSRGANGVIVITTKGGRDDGKTDISFKVSGGLQYIPSRLSVLNPYEYVKYQQNVAFAKDGYSQGTNTDYFNSVWVDPELYQGVEGISWQDEIFRVAYLNSYSLSVSGGNKKTQYYYSGELNDQQGTLINTDFTKIINNLKLTHHINDKLELRAGVQYSFFNRGGLQVSGNNSTSVIRDAIQFRPVDPIIDDGLENGYDINDPEFQFLFNPIRNLENTTRNRRNDVIRGNGASYFKITKDLTLKASGSYQRDIRNESTFFGADTQQATRGVNGIHGIVRDRLFETLTTSNTINYRKSINKKHKLQFLVGMEAQSRSYAETQFASYNLPTDAFGIDNLGLGATSPVSSSYKEKNTLLSYFGRGNYNLDGKYLLTVNFRADASSKFSDTNRWGYFPSFSMAWRIVEEDFMQSIGLISDLKFRGGWGRTGNNRIGGLDSFNSYNLLGVTNTSGYVWGIGENYTPGTQQVNLGVPDLTWETTDQVNVGIDYALSKHRIQGSFDAYLKKTSDLLLDANMALSTGFDQVRQNVGEVENRGLELTVITTNVKTKRFEWKTNFNVSMNRNKVIKLNEGQEAIYTDPEWNVNSYSEFQYITKVGEAVGQVFGLEYDGIYQNEDFSYNSVTGVYTLRDGIPDNGALPVAPGSVRFVDQNGDGTINVNDRKIIGNTQALLEGGLSNDFVFKGFDLHVFFQWSYGAEILNANRAVFEIPNGTALSGLTALGEAWTPTSTDTDVNAVAYNLVFGQPPVGNRIDDRYIEDGSFIRLKTVSFGYNLSEKLLSKFKLKSCRFSVASQNLNTWTNYTGYDPEVSVGKFGALTPNLDYSAYPQSITITGGIDITF